MSGGDTGEPPLPKHMTYSKSQVPLIGAFIDYVDTSLDYIVRRSFNKSEKLNAKFSRSSLSAGFLAVICFLLGFTCNVKFEVVTLDDEPLPKDLHFMLMSTEDKIYIEDIDVSRYSASALPILLPYNTAQRGNAASILGTLPTSVMWCVEASDMTVLLICCILIFNSAFVKSPISEYLFLPWLGLTLRGLFLRQAPTVGALLYTMAVINGTVNLLFLTAFSFLFLLEVRMWLEIARVIRSRWERRGSLISRQNDHYEVETLWSNDDVQSVEVQNYVY